jgi:hypothetical protein
MQHLKKITSALSMFVKSDPTLFFRIAKASKNAIDFDTWRKENKNLRRRAWFRHEKYYSM